MLPLTGRSRVITPLRSFSSATASLTGSGTACLLSVAAPNSS